MADKYISIDMEVNNFSKYLKKRKMTKKSIEQHCKVVRKYFLDYQTISPVKEDVIHCVEKMKSKGLSPNTINNFLSAIDQYILFNGGKRLNIPREDKKSFEVRTFLSKEQVSRILSGSKNIREKALLSVLAYTGLKPIEICALKTKDILFSSNEIRIGHGRSARRVYISGECCEILKEYLQKFARDDNEYLFTTLKQGNKFTGWALRRVVRLAVSRANIKRNVSPRDFRNSLAIHLIENRARIITIIDQLGHKEYSTIAKYEKQVVSDRKKDYQESVPNYLNLKD